MFFKTILDDVIPVNFKSNIFMFLDFEIENLKCKILFINILYYVIS